MATIQNDRDVRLQATVPRNLNPAAGKILLLSCDTANFQVNNVGAATPTAINFTALLLGFPVGTAATFSCSAGGTLTGSGNTRQLAFTNMSVGSVTVTASITYGGATFSDIKLITKVVDGATAGLSTAVFYAYQRSATAPTLKPGAVTYTFASGAITTPATDALANGWTKSIPAGVDPLYITVASASATTATDTVADAEWASPVLFVRDGVNGINTATIYLYQRAATNVAPALPSASVVYTFATSSLTAPNNGWTQVPPSSGGDFLFVTTATAAASTATDTILASEWATANLMVQNGVNGTSALHNGQAYAYQRSATTLSSNPGAVSYDFTTGTITTATLANGWTKTIPAGTDPLYITIAAASNLSTTDSILSTEWATPVKLAQDGVAGLNTTTVFIYQRSASSTAPALPSATATYTFSPPGLTGLNNGWSTVIPVTGGNYVFVSTATAAATTATDTIASTEWAPASILSQDGTGTRGAGTFYASGTSWSDTVADAATPGANVIDDTVTISGTGFVMVKKWTGSAWVAQGQVIDGSLIVTNSITAAQINTNGLQIRDNSGNIMLGTGSALDWTKLAAAGVVGGTPILNSAISLSASGALNGAGGGSVSLGGLGFSGDTNATYNPGAFANLTGTITAANAASYFAANSLDGTYIANLVANKINSGTLSSIAINIGSGAFQVSAGGSATMSGISVSVASFGNLYSPGSPCVSASTISASSAPAIEGAASAGAYDFYASGAGTNYGPFTGAHDALWHNADDALVELGDLMVDVECIARGGLSNTLFRVEPSSAPNQRGVIGVLAAKVGALERRVPAVFVLEMIHFEDHEGRPLHTPRVDPAYDDLKDAYQLGAVNSLGEGQMNVCGEGGDLAVGDFLVASSMRGKGMRQADDILRSCTVARARESVTFDSPDQVKLVACVYVCG